MKNPAVAKATILPRTTIILYIIKLTAHILKPRVHVEPVLNLIMKSGLDSVVRESLNGVNINFSVIISLNGVNINFSVINTLKLMLTPLREMMTLLILASRVSESCE
jgi:hypothetical protein